MFSRAEFMLIAERAFKTFPVMDIVDKNGNQYVLRQHTPSDAGEYCKFYNEPEIAKFLPDSLVFENETKAREELECRISNFTRRDTVYWCIAEKSTNKLIGGCGFLDWSMYNKRIELAYDLKTQYWNRGIMKAALQRVVAFGFVNMRLVRIQATTPIDNDKSISILKKHLRFTHEATLQNYKYWKGRYVDVNMFGITIQTFCKNIDSGLYPFLSETEIQNVREFCEVVQKA